MLPAIGGNMAKPGEGAGKKIAKKNKKLASPAKDYNLPIIDKNSDVVEPQTTEIESTFDEKYRSMCLAISNGANPGQFIHMRWLPIEIIDNVYKSYIRELIRQDHFDELINSTLERIRFEEGFTYSRAAYILQWSNTKVAKLFKAYRDNQCTK